MPLTDDQFTAADVTVAIVSYNTRQLLERCIQSAIAEAPHGVLVIDNASTDDSVAAVRRGFPSIGLLENAVNTGYGAAINQALGATTTPLLFVLNADTEVQPGCLAALAAAASRSPKAGIIAPAIVNRRGVPEISVFPFPGTVGWLLENKPLAGIVRRIPPLARRSVSLRTSSTARPVPWVLGAAMLLRRDCMRAIEGFDEDFFMYYEEVDLCRRASDAGWQVLFEPSGVVMHVGGASTGQQRTIMAIRRFESSLRYYHRYFSGPKLVLWLSALHLKRSLMLARASAQLLVERDPTERHRLLQQRSALSGILEVSRSYARKSGAIGVRDQPAG